MKRKFTKKNIRNVKTKPCAYKLYNKSGKILRNGATRNCKIRLTQQLGKFAGVTSFSARTTNTWSQAHNIEIVDCRELNPPLNLKCG